MYGPVAGSCAALISWLAGRAGGNRVCPRECQLVEETGIGGGQVKGHGAGGVIGDDTAREVARAAFPLAPAGPNDPGVEGQDVRLPLLVDHEYPLDRATEVARPDKHPGRVPDASAEPERVGPAAVGGYG
jgi:hypothetical protein